MAEPFKPNGAAMRTMRLVLALNEAKEEIERLRRENLELINEIRVLKLKDIVRREHGSKKFFVRRFNEGVVR
ncbi:MAG: hypothetical protein AB7D43_13545 [Sulfurimonadaceae bacterium]